MIHDEAVAAPEVAEHEVREVVDVVIGREERGVDAKIGHHLADVGQATLHLGRAEGGGDGLAVADVVLKSFAFHPMDPLADLMAARSAQTGALSKEAFSCDA